ncbi:MAG: hypothetical protein JSS12_03570 [Verrucomicrobia bacterium]|nr:hypothetical protein [Verrucomicrobiota bacterium]
MRSLASNAFLQNALSTRDTDWAYRLGKNRYSKLQVETELQVELMTGVMVHANQYLYSSDRDRVKDCARVLRAFLIGRFEFLHETAPDNVVEIITPEIETVLNQLNSKGVNYYLHYFSLELCKGLPPILLPAVMNTLYNKPYKPDTLASDHHEQRYNHFFHQLLYDAVERSDAEQLSVLLTDQRFYSQRMPFEELDLTSERAVACVEVMLASEKVNIDIVSVVCEYFPNAYRTGPYKKIREILLCDRRSKGKELTELLCIDQTRLIDLLLDAKKTDPGSIRFSSVRETVWYLRSSVRDCPEHPFDQIFWRKLVDKLIRNPNEILKRVVTIWGFPEPIFNSIVKRCLNHHELTDNDVGDALYEIARQGQYSRLQLFLADRRVRISTIVRAHLGQGTFIPEPFHDIACYRRTKAILNAELIARTTRPIIIAISATALLLIHLVDKPTATALLLIYLITKCEEFQKA